MIKLSSSECESMVKSHYVLLSLSESIQNAYIPMYLLSIFSRIVCEQKVYMLRLTFFVLFMMISNLLIMDTFGNCSVVDLARFEWDDLDHHLDALR